MPITIKSAIIPNMIKGSNRLLFIDALFEKVGQWFYVVTIPDAVKAIWKAIYVFAF
jgi:hypothetical protein